MIGCLFKFDNLKSKLALVYGSECEQIIGVPAPRLSCKQTICCRASDVSNAGCSLRNVR